MSRKVIITASYWIQISLLMNLLLINYKIQHELVCCRTLLLQNNEQSTCIRFLLYYIFNQFVKLNRYMFNVQYYGV